MESWESGESFEWDVDIYVVVVVVQLRGVEASTFTQRKGVTLLFMYSLYIWVIICEQHRDVLDRATFIFLFQKATGKAKLSVTEVRNKKLVSWTLGSEIWTKSYSLCLLRFKCSMNEPWRKIRAPSLTMPCMMRWWQRGAKKLNLRGRRTRIEKWGRVRSGEGGSLVEYRLTSSNSTGKTRALIEILVQIWLGGGGAECFWNFGLFECFLDRLRQRARETSHFYHWKWGTWADGTFLNIRNGGPG